MDGGSGSLGEAQTTRIIEWLAADRRVLGSAFVRSPTLAKSGMPFTHEGRRVRASPEELNRWLGREVSEPVQIATEATDLSSELSECRRG
jgi:hypothetical protein